MSIREYIDANGAFSMSKVATTNVNIGGVEHSVINGGYSIKDSNSGNTLMSFDNSNNLSESQIKTYCDAILTTVNTLNTSALALIGTVQDNVNNLQINGAVGTLAQVLDTGANGNNLSVTNLNNVSCASITLDGSDLQTQLNNLQTYKTNLRHFFTVFSSAASMIDPNTNEQFDFSGLL